MKRLMLPCNSFKNIVRLNGHKVKRKVCYHQMFAKEYCGKSFYKSCFLLSLPLKLKKICFRNL